MTLTIARCGDCPFSCRDRNFPACNAATYLEPHKPTEPRRFGVWHPVEPYLIYPTPPPDWCPLRVETVSIAIGKDSP